VLTTLDYFEIIALGAFGGPITLVAAGIGLLPLNCWA
jgi:hypothetical protein